MAEGKKYGRDQFTKALGRIAEKVNGQQEYLIRYSNTLFGRREEESCRILVKNLWAAGSWARGALECGDLDLVLEVSALEGMLPFESNIRRAVIGGARYVRTYIGTPQKNSSGATFDEAVLIWSPKSTNWKHNINSVKPDPNAARFSRKTDELPLRPEQLQGDFPDELEKLIEMRNEGYLCWEWVEIDSIIPKPENWFEGAQAISEFASKWCGKRTQRIMPFVLQWFEDRESVVCSNTDHTNKPEFKINGAEVFVGRPSIPVYRLNDLSCSTLVLVPYITGKGPNGLWIIRRGDRHPVIKSSRDLGAYVLFDGGQLRTSTYIGSGYWDRIEVLEIYSSHKLAQEKLEDEVAYLDKEGISDAKLEIQYCIGPDLLNLLAKVDEIFIDNVAYAITLDASFFEKRNNEIDVPVISANELREILSEH